MNECRMRRLPHSAHCSNAARRRPGGNGWTEFHSCCCCCLVSRAAGRPDRPSFRPPARRAPARRAPARRALGPADESIWTNGPPPQPSGPPIIVWGAHPGPHWQPCQAAPISSAAAPSRRGLLLGSPLGSLVLPGTLKIKAAGPDHRSPDSPRLA